MLISCCINVHNVNQVIHEINCSMWLYNVELQSYSSGVVLER